MGFKEFLRSEFSASNFLMTHPDPRLFVTMQCGPVYLFIPWSVFWSVYHLAWIILDMYNAPRDDKDDGQYFTFLTNWGYLCLVSYQWLVCGATMYIHVTRKDIIQGSEVTMPWYLKVIWVLFNITNSLAFIIVLLYWLLIGSSMDADSIGKHALNGVCVLLNVCLTATPIRVCHFYQPVIVGFIYIVFTVIYQMSGGGLIYTVVDWTRPGATIGLILPLLFIAIPFAHAFCFGIYKARTAIANMCCRGGDPIVKPIENGVYTKSVTPTANVLVVDDLTPDNQSFSVRLTPRETQGSLNISLTPSPIQGFTNDGAELEP